MAGREAATTMQMLTVARSAVAAKPMLRSGAEPLLAQPFAPSRSDAMVVNSAANPTASESTNTQMPTMLAVWARFTEVAMPPAA